MFAAAAGTVAVQTGTDQGSLQVALRRTQEAVARTLFASAGLHTGRSHHNYPAESQTLQVLQELHS
jgi:hypothetical protein